MARTKNMNNANTAAEVEAQVVESAATEVVATGINELLGLGTTSSTASSRAINGALELNTYAQNEARRLVETFTSTLKAGDLSIKSMIDEVLDTGDYSKTCDLILNTIGSPKCEALEMCSDDELSRLLESRRSDRSKTKKKGLRTSVVVMLNFFAAVIAEMAIRAQSGKAYVAQNTSSLDVEALATDQEALNKKIRSLQSKQSNLRRALKYIPAETDAPEREELEKVQTQIALLQSKRTNAPTSKTMTTKVPSKADLKNAIAQLSEEEKLELIAQLQSV